jgi:hypothetical protein
MTTAVALFLLSLSAFATDMTGNAPDQSDVKDGLKVSDNHHYLVDATTGKPVFILADTAWNLGALKIEEIDTYLQTRADHGFNTVMFALNFAPQADEKNAYGQPAYIGPEHDELNPAYFETCDRIIQDAESRGLYVMIFTLWAGEDSGTMNRYSPAQLSKIGHALGKRYAGIPNVIFCVGGEATPSYRRGTGERPWARAERGLRWKKSGDGPSRIGILQRALFRQVLLAGFFHDSGKVVPGCLQRHL